ncbi:MAG: CvpA family protein [Rickettsiales bacterium]|jgi:membrane protein required for colicin V production|nr:CvpA family protein [Rickettsiales bacterium]
MTDFTLFDYLYIAVAFGSALWAFYRGGVYELVATISWIAAALSSRFVSPAINDFLQKMWSLPEPTIGTLVASYFIVFFGVLVVFGLFNQRLRDWIQDSILLITDRTLGVIFGLVRAVIVMGLAYWAMLWYYEDAAKPAMLTAARSRPMMQLTAVKINEWFVGKPNKLLERDMTGAKEAEDLLNNLINPAVKAASIAPDNSMISAPAEAPTEPVETGYKDSERDDLEKTLNQLENLPPIAE